MSAPVKQWVQSLHLKAIQVASDRAKDGKRRLGATHFRVLLHLADRARHNGLAWPGMSDIAKAAEIGIDLEHPDLRRARRVVRDLEVAGLIKCEQFRGRVKGKEYASSEYWVRVPWVAEPERVSDLPKLGNDELPPGVRTKDQKGGRAEIDVDHYIRQEKLRPVNRVPAPYLDEVGSAKSGAGINDVAVNRVPEALNRAPVSGLNRAPAPSKSGISGESGSEAASPEAVSARLRARDEKAEAIGELNTRSHSYVQQNTLDGFAAVGLVSPAPAPAATISVVDALAEGKRIWESARHQLLRPGAGVDPALIARARNTASAGYSAADGVLTLDGDLVAEDLEPGSTIAAAVASAARGRQLELRLVGGAPPANQPVGPLVVSRAPASATSADTQRPHDEAAIRARIRSKLSAEELALLDKLERRRISYAEGPMAPAADDQFDETEVVEQRSSEVDSDVAQPAPVDEEPRRQRTKATAVA